MEVLRAASAFPAGVVLTSLLEAVERFTGKEEQADDLSVVVVRRPSAAEQGGLSGGEADEAAADGPAVFPGA